MTLSPSLSPSGRRPWEKQQLSSVARLGLFVLTIVLLSILLVALIIVLVFAVDPSSKTGPGFGAAAVATLVGLVCAGGLYWSIPSSAARCASSCATRRRPPFWPTRSMCATPAMCCGPARQIGRREITRTIPTARCAS
jgi:hypothetical protein